MSSDYSSGCEKRNKGKNKKREKKKHPYKKGGRNRLSEKKK
jgi:hypothetical protein